MNVVDSSGWIEFFLNSRTAYFFAPAIEDPQALIVPSIALLEVHRFLSRKARPTDLELCLNTMRRGRVIDMDDSRAIAASEAGQRHRLATADAIMYAAAIEFGASLWTQEIDYKDLPQVRYIDKTASNPP